MTTDTDIVIEPTTSVFFDCEPDTYYDAIVRNITAVPNTFPDARSDTQLQWDFEVVGEANDDGTQASKRAWSSPTWTPRSKLYKWATAINGPQDKDATFRTSSLIDKPCRIILLSGFDEKGNPTAQLNVAAPVAAKAPKKPGLVARLKAEGIETVEVADFTTCSTTGCDSTEDLAFTSRGTPFCGTHMP